MANLGPDFLVNTTTDANQQSPSVTALSDGRFVAVWQSGDNGDGSGTCIRMRIYNPNGTPAGDDQIVNTATGNDQTLPVVAALENGGFVIAWESALSDGGTDSGIRARVYDATGTALGSEFLAHTTTTGNQIDPAIVALDGGGFAIAWTSDDGSEVGTALRARIFDADGAPLANDFHVNQGAQNGDQTNVSLAATDDGGFVATWQSTDLNFDTDGSGIRALVFDSSGVPVGGGAAEIQVNLDGGGEEINGNQFDPAVTVLADGRYLVTWTTNDFNDDGSSSGVMGRIFNADSTPAGNVFVVNGTTLNDQVRSHIAATPNGGFVAVYMSEEGLGDSDIRARLFDQDGNAIGNDFVVNIGAGSDTGIQRDPSVTVLPDGRIVVAWWNDEPGFDGSGAAIQAMIFTADGNGITGVTVGGTGDADVLTGSEGNDTLTGGAGGDELNGGDGDDLLLGGAGDDQLNGNNDDDTLEGGAGFDQISGGNHNVAGDTVTYANNAVGVYVHFGFAMGSSAVSGGDASFDQVNGIENVFGTQFDDTLIGDEFDNKFVGGDGKNILDGGAGNDILLGGSGIDTVSGGDGDDTIHTLGGADVIDGGAGFDILSYAGSAAGVTLTLGVNGAKATGSGAGSDALGDQVSNVEAVFGSDKNDKFTGNALDNRFDGGDGNDVIAGMAGNDELEGGEGNDTLDGGDGDDILRPGAGIDIVKGGNGNDTVSYDTGTTDQGGISITLGVNGALTTATGAAIAAGDTISAVENVVGTDDNDNPDTITGNALDNIINGMSGKDVLEGGGNTAVGDTLSYEFSDPAVSVLLNVVGGYSGGHAEGDEAQGFENVIGGRGADTITGDGGDNVIEGRELGDALDGGLGNDTLSYAGSDAGVGIALGGGGTGGHAQGDGNVGFENILGSAFNDTLGGDNSANRLTGGGGDDTLTALDSADILDGGDGDDILFGGTGDDTLNGGAGDDELYGDTGDDTIDGGEGGNDTVFFNDAGVAITLTLGTSGAATFTNGTTGVDIGKDKVSNVENIVGSDKDDKFTGNAFNNYIEGGKGADIMDGGGGTGDTLSYASSTGAVTVTLNLAAFGAPSTGGEAAGDTNKNFENLRGGSDNDKLTGNSLANVIEGGAGGDEMHGGAGIDTLSYEHGTVAGVEVELDATGTIGGGDGDAQGDTGGGFENLIGSIFSDSLISNHTTVATVIDGRGGDDFITGTDVASGDTLTGGDGDDTIDGEDGNDKIFGGDGVDNLEGGDGNDTIEGGAGDDTLEGNADNDTVNGGAGDDELEGGSGTDILNGGDGDDGVVGGAGADTMDGGAGWDGLVFFGTAGTLTVDLAKGIVTASGANDGVGDKIKNFEAVHADLGAGASATLIGTAGYNELSGGTGDDIIEGGGAGDKLDGGAGENDTLSYKTSKSGVIVDLDVAPEEGRGFAGDADGDVLENFENVIGSDFNDTLIGQDDAELSFLDGGKGDDLIDIFDDYIVLGGLGSDTLSVADAGAGLNINLALQGKANATRTNVTGGGGNIGSIIAGQNVQATEIENLIGTGFNDTLTGDAANNVIEGGGGADVLDGGAGTGDTLSYRSSTSGVDVVLGLAAFSAPSSGGDAQGDTNKNFENLIGSEVTDANLEGNALKNKIEGLGGDDYIFGGGDIDTLFGGDGDDNIMGHLGADIIDGGAGFDYVSYTSGDETVGITIVLGKDGTKGTAKGGHAEGDQITNVEHIFGSAKNDVLTGNNLVNELYGGDGDDTIQGGAGADTLDGGANGAAGDTLSYELSALGVNVSLNPSASGGDADGDTISNFENLTGSKKNDTLSGDAGANTINGLDGDDLINGRAGADAMDGGAGIDTLTYATSGTGVTVTLNLATVVGAGSNGDAQGDTNKNFENIIGSADVDKLVGNSLNNVIEGGDAGDILDGAAHGTGGDTVDYSNSDEKITVYLNGANSATNISGGHAQGDDIKNFENLIASGFADEIGGDAGSNVLSGLAGNDYINGFLGNDTLRGGDDDDELDGSIGADKIFGESGNDKVTGGTEADELSGGSGNDTVDFSSSVIGVKVDLSKQSTVDGAGKFIGGVTGVGGDAQGDKYEGFENVTGSDANDTLTGDANINVIGGGLGDDIIEGGAGADTLDGGDGTNDTLSYANSSNTVVVNLGNLTQTGGDAQDDTTEDFENVTGSAFNDALTGNGIANKLLGGGGDDVLQGFDGNDILDGGDGNDEIYGGDKNDLFANNGLNTITGGKGNDKLFGGGDVDNIDGGDGDDVVLGGAGGDTLKGGAHTTGVGDTLSYAGNAGSVTVTLKGTTLAAAVSGGDAAGDTATGFENLIGSNAIDKLTGDTGANVIDGGDGADILDGGAGSDTLSFATGNFVVVDLGKGIATGGGHDGMVFLNFENIRGSNDSDEIIGDAKVNTLDGGGSNDIIFGGDGADTILGGDDNSGDILEADFDSEFDLSLTKGTDTVSGGGGNDVIGAGLGVDKLDGGTNTAIGDTLSYIGFSAVVSVTLGAQGVAVTTAKVGTESDSIKNFENVVGGSGNDTLTGNADANILVGQDGDDTLTGNDGDDNLIGEAGDDTFIGGKGADTFYGATVTDPSDPFAFFDLGGLDTFPDNDITGFDTVIYARETGTNAVTVDLSDDFGRDTFGDSDTLRDIEVVFGSAFNDRLSGSDNLDPGSNTNNEGFGGLKGNDIIEGGVDGVANHDEVRYDRDAEFGGTAGVTVNLVNVLVNGTFNGKAINIAANTAKDGFGTFDTISNIEGIRGTAQADWFFANDGNGQGLLKGLKGADYIQGDGEDFVDYSADGEYGGSGRALVILSNFGVNLQATATTMLSVGGGKGIDGFGTIDTIVLLNNIQGTNSTANGTHALAVNDVLMGNNNVNEIRSMGGNDSLVGLQGADILDGGDGAFDEASYIYENNPSIGVVVNLSSVTKLGVASKTATDSFGATDTLISIEAAAGSAYDDKLFGGFGANRFYGYSGDDTIDGTEDVGDISGVTDLDIVEYGRDNLLGGTGAIAVDLGAGTAKDGFGDDDLLTDIEIVIGGKASADNLKGGDTDNDDYEGFAGLGGADIINGVSGFDEARYDFDEFYGATAGITVNVALGTIKDGFATTDTISNIDAVRGTSKADTFNGGATAMIFRGLAGADVFKGGAGLETIDYSVDHEHGATHGIIANLTGTAQVVDLALIGKSGTLSVAGFKVYDSFSGTTAVLDSIIAVSGVSTIENVTGTQFNDVIFANGEINKIDGSGGIDTVVYGGTLGIVIELGANGAQTFGNGGHASDDALTNIENVTTGSGADTLTGNNLANVLSSGSGDDFLAGLEGADTLNGGDGTDTVYYSNDAGVGATHGVIVNLSSSTVVVGDLDAATNFGYTLGGDIFVQSGTAYDAFNNDTLIFDTLISIERVVGTDFKDILIGNNAVNRLTGGLGADILTGGAGGDGFQYNAAAEGDDNITDFNVGEDFIRINKAGFLIAEDGGQHNEAAQGILALDPDYFVLGTAADQAGHGQFIYDGSTGELFWDDDGTGGNAQVLIATLQGTPALTINDILLV